MIKRILLFGLIVLSINTYSQKDSTFRFKIYTSPLQAIDIFSRPMVTLGCEYRLLQKVSISGEFGYKYHDMDDYDTAYVKTKGYSCRFEMKFYGPYFFHNKKRITDYFSLEYRYIKDDYNSMFDYSANSLSEVKLTDNYGIMKDIYIGNLKYGLIFSLGQRIYFDFYTGLGFRNRNVKNINREFDEKLGHEHWYPEYFWTISDFKENSGLKFNLSLGFKFGIKI